MSTSLKDILNGSSSKCSLHSCGGEKKSQGSFRILSLDLLFNKSPTGTHYLHPTLTIPDHHRDPDTDTQNIVYPWYTGFDYPRSFKEIKNDLLKYLWKENRYKPKPVPKTCTSSAIAPSIEVYGQHNIFIVSNYGSHEDTKTSTLVPQPFQNCQDPKHELALF